MAMSSIRTLRKRTVPQRPEGPALSAPDDPLGLDVQGRGMEHARAHMTPFGPLPDPRWAGFFQALEDAGVNKLVAGPSAPGSTQIRGQSLQPRFLSGGTAGDALAAVEQSMPYYVPPPPPAEGKAPTAPPGPPAPKSPPLPPPTRARPASSPSAAPPSSSASLGSLAAQTGVPGAVTRYGNAYPGAPVTAAAFLPSDVNDDLETPETAAERLRQMKARIVT